MLSAVSALTEELVPVPAAAASELLSVARRSRQRALWLAGAGLLCALLAVLFRSVAVGAVAAGAAAFAAVFGLAAVHALRAGRQLASGCRRVLLVGWLRVPDSCNYAVFAPGEEPTTAAVDVVVRLTTVQPPRTLEGLLVAQPSRLRSAALFTEDGELLCVGRFRRPRSARRVWARRDRPTPRWIGVRANVRS
jgi:hypothetical protein